VYKTIGAQCYQDERGFIKKVWTKTTDENMDFYSKTIAVGEVFLLYSKPGAVRGNHDHKETVEYFKVVKGRTTFLLSDVKGDGYEEVELDESSNDVLIVFPNTIHSFKNNTNEELIIVVVSSRGYDDKNADTF